MIVSHNYCCRLPRAASRLLTLSLLCMAGFVNVQPAGANGDENGNTHKSIIVAPSEKLFGYTYEELATRWVNWIQIEPPETNPALDETGAFCDANQKGQVWFLAGSFGGILDRFCKVPAGKALFFPLINYISFPPDFPDPGDPCENLDLKVEQIRCDVNEDIEVEVGPAPDTILSLSLDGEPVGDLFAYRIQSRPGGFVFDSGPLFEAFGVEPGPRYPSVIDGYWILIRPLRPGTHELSFSADSPNLGILGANYTLLVAKRARDED